MTERFIVYAPNVGSGGGLSLLNAFLSVWRPTILVSAILDERARRELHIPEWIDVHWSQSSAGGRWRAERLLSKLARQGDTTLCFHNLPPIFSINGKVFCYLQNANLVGMIPTAHLSGWVRLRYVFERFIARRFHHRIDRYMVQTPTMGRALARWFEGVAPGKVVPPIDILPFVDPQAMPAPQGSTDRAIEWDFIYVSDGATHKNHALLFEAWTILAKEGLFPSLAITLHPERDSALRDKLASLNEEFGLAIVDLGQMPHAQLLKQYVAARALFFASYAESFGIPLLEAQAAGLPIIAAELDFVRDMCKPVESFDPTSPVSMARAAKRFLHQQSDAVLPLTPADFIDRLIAIGGPN